MERQAMTVKTYEIKYHCGNCDKSTVANIPHGEEAPETMVCGVCGCLRAKKLMWQSDDAWQEGKEEGAWEEGKEEGAWE